MPDYITGRPDPSEYAPYAKAYVDLVEGDDVLRTLAIQIEDTVSLLTPVGDRRASELAYAPGKWTVKQVIGHIIDTERIFAYRALRVARNDATPLAGFEQDDYVRAAGFNECRLEDLLQEFRAVRHSTLLLFRSLAPDAWLRRGVANNFPVSVRGQAYLAAGHEQHHVRILREKYLR